MKLRHASLLLLALTFAASLTGCFLFAVGAVGAAGAYAYHGNKLETVEGASIERTADAAVAGLNDLEIKGVNKSADKLTGKITATTAQGKTVTIDLKRREEAVTEVNIRVGSGFLEEEKAQAMAVMEKMRKHLP